MMMESTLPGWLTPTAWVFIGLGVLSAAVIVYDIYVRRNRQDRRVMELVWPVAALVLGPLAVWAYYLLGRAQSSSRRALNGAQPTSAWARLIGDGTRGAAAATIAHFIGVPIVTASGLTIAGTDLWVTIIVIGVLAIVILFLFEIAASTESRASRSRSLLTAIVVVLAFDIGMGGWMILLHFTGFMPPPTDITFAFLMQLGVVVGSLTAYPVVRLLTRRGTAGTTAPEVGAPQAA